MVVTDFDEFTKHALELAIPCKVKREQRHSTGDLIVTVALCPRCNKVFDLYEKPNYCSKCGQHVLLD